MQTNTKITDMDGITSISSSVTIPLKRDEVWKYLKTPGDIEKFHPLIKESYMTSEKVSEDGAIRYCKMKPMGEMVEEITNWVEGFGFETVVIDGKMLPPHEFMKGRLEIKDIGGETEVIFSFNYKLKFGFIGSLLNKVIVKPQFKNAPAKYVEGVYDYIMK
jgi:uncharacterized membrane protein